MISCKHRGWKESAGERVRLPTERRDISTLFLRLVNYAMNH